MKLHKLFAAATVTLIVTLMLAPGAGAQTYQVLYTFTGGTDGAYPEMEGGGLIFDAAGNLYGTNARRGNPGNWNGQGVVFQLTPGAEENWTETSSYIFCVEDWNVCSDGAYPSASLIFDTAGNLYGAAFLGGIGGCYNDGIYGCGVIFKLAANPDGSWAYVPLYKFTGGDDGANPVGRLTFDKAGNLYGTTWQGGAYEYGVVFELSPNQDGTWSQQVIHHFRIGADGANPYAGLRFDGNGNLYGTASGGGGYGYGTIFKLTPRPDGSWSWKVLHHFTGGKDGANPYAGVTFDDAGNLYGTTFDGGTFGRGVLFKGTPNPDGSWNGKVRHHFTGGKDGANPFTDLLFDADGNLYGTTYSGGAYGGGVVFKSTPNPDGSWSGKILHHFTCGEDGCGPRGGLTLDSAGNLFGTTNGGSPYGYGVVFEIMP